MKLFYAPGACSLASHITAEEAGLPLDLEKVDLKSHKTEYGEDFYHVNPKGYVPALALEDGEVLTENTAILPYLADQKPSAGLAPPPGTMERLRMVEWLGFISSELHKAYAPFFHDDDSPHKASARNTIEKRFEFVAGEMANRPFLLDGHFSVADAYLYVMLRWAPKAGIDLSTIPSLAEYRSQITERPAVQRALKSEGLTA